MRWVFFCLLVLNVVYLVWSLVVSAVTPGAPVLRDSPVAAPTLQLLSEAGTGVDPSGAAEAPLEMCVALGAWESLGDADGVLKKLAANGYAGRIRTVTATRDRLYWVYLPPVDERDEALRVLRELQAKGVDSFVVSEGEDANAVSLGYFSSDESARGLAVKMNAAGYPAQTRETDRKVSEYWLYFKAQSIPDGAQAVRDLVAGDAGLKAHNVACNASPRDDAALSDGLEEAVD